MGYDGDPHLFQPDQVVVAFGEEDYKKISSLIKWLEELSNIIKKNLPDTK